MRVFILINNWQDQNSTNHDVIMVSKSKETVQAKLKELYEEDKEWVSEYDAVVESEIHELSSWVESSGEYWSENIIISKELV